MMMHVVPMVVNSQIEVVRLLEIAERLSLENPAHKIKLTQVGGPTDFETAGKRYLDVLASPARIQQFQDTILEMKRAHSKLVKLSWDPDAKPVTIPEGNVPGELVASALAGLLKADIDSQPVVTDVTEVPPADDRGDDGVAQDDDLDQAA